MNKLFTISLALATLFLVSCSKKSVEPEDPNKIDFAKTKVSYSAWKTLDLDGELTFNRDFYITSANADVAHLREEVVIKNRDNQEESFSDVASSNSVVVSFYRFKNRNQTEVQGHEVNFGQENWISFKVLIPDRSGVNETDFTTLSITMLPDVGKFESSIALGLIENNGGNFIYREIPEFRDKNQAFFKSYVNDLFQVRHVVITDVTKEQLAANGFYANYNYDYDAIVKAFGIE